MQQAKKKKKGNQILKGERKLFLFTDDEIIYVDNRVESTKNLLKFKVSFVKFQDEHTKIN